MSTNFKNVRTVDWDGFEPTEIADVSRMQGKKTSRFRGWVLILLHLLAFFVIFVSFNATNASADAQVATRELDQFGRNLQALEKEAFQGEDVVVGQEIFLQGVTSHRVAFQKIEPSVRLSDAVLARNIGILWTDIRREALLGELDLEKLRKVKQLVENGERHTAGIAQAQNKSAWLYRLASFGLLVFCLVGSVASLSKQGSTLVVQSVMSSQSDISESVVPVGSYQGMDVIDRLPTPLVRISVRGVIENWNESAEALTAITSGEALGRSFMDVLEWSALGDIAKTTFYRVFKGETVYDIEWEFAHRSGQPLQLRAKFVPVKDDFGGVGGAIVALQDVTTEKRNKKMLTDSDAVKSSMLKALTDTMFRLAFDGEMIELHDHAHVFENPAGLKGQNWKQVLNPELVALITQSQKEALKTRSMVQAEVNQELVACDRDFRLDVVPCGSSDVLAILKTNDLRIQEVQESKETLLYTDSLTGLPDRRSTDEYLDAILNFVNLGDGTASIVYFDVDDFRNIIEEEGFAVGDIVLRELASQIRSACRESDVVGRYDADSFLWILPMMQGNQAQECAKRVTDEIGWKVTSVVLDLGLVQVKTKEEIIQKFESAIHDNQDSETIILAA